MITIEERKTLKMPGETSLFLMFDYNPDIIEALKRVSPRQFHTKIKAWEVPLTALSDVIDILSVYDDITFNWLPDKEVAEDQAYKVQDYKTKPFQHQIDGIQFGLNHPRFLLLDEPGLGKTLQIIYMKNIYLKN